VVVCRDTHTGGRRRRQNRRKCGHFKPALTYLREQPEPVQMNIMAAALRDRNPQLRNLRDSDFRDVVQPMIVTGKVHYTAGLKVRLGDKTKA
jgi:hypothetical protein